MRDIKIAIIGLGYVGLPLARLFATKYSVVGFDIDEKRISQLILGKDTTLEVSDKDLKAVLVNKPSKEAGLFCSENKEYIKDCNHYIITVPTPVDKKNNPDLTPLINATEIVGKFLNKGDVVIYESTVYPGATEEECVPVLEKTSGLKFNQGFYVGYSPERINPGDKEHTVEKILKVTSGSTLEIGKQIDDLYRSVIIAGTHLAPTIKVAEASKVIENTQRDVNIAFVNELSKMFSLMGINSYDVLDAANTKWNFLPFKPGLVGGHCIGVDPYYLVKKAQEFGYNPEIILAARKINESMGRYISAEVIKLMIKKKIKIASASILILGITFKENCKDLRNTKVLDIINSLQEYNIKIDVYDPWADKLEVKEKLNINLQGELNARYDGVILAVNHNEFKTINFKKLCKKTSVIYDVKNSIPQSIKDGGL